ncbi:hypothetical protein ACHAXS_005431 [Conticribra weissflogii]
MDSPITPSTWIVPTHPHSFSTNDPSVSFLPSTQLIHLLRHRLRRIDQTPRHQPHRHEHPTHDPHQRTQKHQKPLPPLPMPHRQRREVVRDHQPRQQRRPLRRQRLRLDDVPGHRSLIRFDLGRKRILGDVGGGHQFDGDVGQRHAGSVVHDVLGVAEGVDSGREGGSECQGVDVVRDVGELAVEGVRFGLAVEEVDAEGEEGGGAAPGGGGDGDGEGSADSGDLDGADEGAALLAFGLGVGREGGGEGGFVFFDGGDAFFEFVWGAVVVLEFALGVGVAVVGVVEGVARQVGEGDVDAEGDFVAREEAGGGALVEEGGGDGFGEVHGVTGLDLEVHDELGQEEGGGGEGREEGYEASGYGTFADAVYWFGESVEGPEGGHRDVGEGV